MTISNHAATGAVIGLLITRPALALPLAFISHFVIDALPHFGYRGHKGFGAVFKRNRYKIIAVAEPVLLLVLLSVLLYYSVSGWVYLAALFAVSPDIIGVYNYLAVEKHGKTQGKFLYYFHIKFHRPIQMYERPWGIYVEVFYFVIMFGWVLQIVK